MSCLNLRERQIQTEKCHCKYQHRWPQKQLPLPAFDADAAPVGERMALLRLSREVWLPAGTQMQQSLPLPEMAPDELACAKTVNTRPMQGRHKTRANRRPQHAHYFGAAIRTAQICDNGLNHANIACCQPGQYPRNKQADNII